MSDETKSIIDPKYQGRYKEENKDWLAKFIDANATDVVMKTVKTKTVEVDDEGNETEVVTSEEVPSKKKSLNVEALFTIGEKNGLDVEKFRDQIGRKNAPGRLRMTIGNMLRAEARRRFGLIDVNGEFVAADDAFVAGLERTHNSDGSKIEKPKEVAEESTTESEDA